MRALTCLVALLLSGLLVAPTSAAAGGEAGGTPPRIKGDPVYGQVLRVQHGTWDPTPVEHDYQWLRDGRPIRDAVRGRYRLRAFDIGHRLTVRETVTDADGGTARATSEPTARVQRATFTNTERPAVRGVQKWTHAVSATPGRWSVRPERVRYQWLRDGKPIAGATARHYRFAPADVGRHVRVLVTARVEGYRNATEKSPLTRPVGHRVPARRHVTYSVTTRGHVTADLAHFRRLAQQTYEDPRGWRGRGVVFTPVRRGGSFTLVLAQASTVPSFSSECSATYSCRVGRYVIINQTRWQHASPPWNAAHRSLRDYRHLVINHETGHWLGFSHAQCPGRGQLAPVMMQQSKGTDGCRFNPWPTTAELNR